MENYWTPNLPSVLLHISELFFLKLSGFRNKLRLSVVKISLLFFKLFVVTDISRLLRGLAKNPWLYYKEYVGRCKIYSINNVDLLASFPSLSALFQNKFIRICCNRSSIICQKNCTMSFFVITSCAVCKKCTQHYGRCLLKSCVENFHICRVLDCRYEYTATLFFLIVC